MMIRSVTGLLAGLSMCAAAHAGGPGFTPINPPSGGEGAHDAILEEIFGGNFVPSDLDFTNGVITAERVPDFGAPGVLELLTGDADGPEDQIWGDGDEIVVALKAEFAGDQSTFGWIDGESGGEFNPLFQTQNNDDASLIISLSESFRWALDDQSFGNLVTSNPADQQLFGEDVDQLVTYHIVGDDAPNTFLLFFEDRIGGDYDFNDAVIKVSVIPAPASAAALALAGLATARRRRP